MRTRWRPWNQWDNTHEPNHPATTHARRFWRTGCARDCVEILPQRGAKRVLLVTSKSVRSQIEFLVDALKAAKIGVAECRPVPAEPTLKFFETILEETRAERIDSVLGIGGGSAMDVAKLIAAFAGSGQRVKEAFGVDQLRGRGLFVACLPTTAGTGSEVSPVAVLLRGGGIEEEHRQPAPGAGRGGDRPDVDVIGAAGCDGGDGTGCSALHRGIREQIRAPDHGQFCAARDQIDLGKSLSRGPGRQQYRCARGGDAGKLLRGLCLGPVGTAAVHALSYPLGGRFRIAHGISNAVLLPEVLRFNLSSGAERYAQIAAAAGIERDGYALGTAQQGIERFAKLSRDCGAPQRLSELKIPREAIPAMAKSALQVQRLLKNNLRPLTEFDAIQIYEATF